MDKDKREEENDMVAIEKMPEKLTVMNDIRRMMQEGMKKKGITAEEAIKSAGIRRNEE